MESSVSKAPEQNPQLTSLNKELDELTLLNKLRMTKESYDRLMNTKNGLKHLPEQAGVTLSPEDEDYRIYLLQQAYLHLNKMEAYYESHNHEWVTV